MARKAASAKPTQPAESTMNQEAPAEQIEAMQDLFDDAAPAPEAPAEAAAPPAAAKQEPTATPEQTPASKEPEPPGPPADTAKDQPATEATEPKAGEFDAAAPQPKATEQEKEPAVSYDVITRDGVKAVQVDALIKTYQQFPELQRKYVQVKPLVDLAERAGLPADQILPYLELGVKTAMERQQQGGQQAQPAAPAAGQPPPSQAPGAYTGPFKDQDEDNYFKELEPAFHASQWRVWNHAKQAGGQPVELTRRLEAIERQVQARVQAEDQASASRLHQDAQQAVDRKITSWAGDKNDYFQEKVIGPQRSDAFKGFLFSRYPEMRVADLTPEFLSAAFAAFDPKYYNGYLTKLANQRAGQRIFAEGAGPRGASSAKVQLDEQSRHMADMLD